MSICSSAMLPVTFQFLIAIVAYAMNERLARRLDYVQQEPSLLTLAVSRRLHKLLAPNPSRLPQRHPFDRWAVLFTTISRDLLDLIVGPISQRAFIGCGPRTDHGSRSLGDVGNVAA